jgi:hypothetical protein
MSADLTGILRQAELFRSVAAQDLATIVTASRLRMFRRGQVVFMQGDPADT